MDNRIGTTWRGGIFVVDPAGSVFRRLCTASLSMPLWQATGGVGQMETIGPDLAIVAAYGAPVWSVVTDIASRVRAMILATRPTDHEAARALVAGAVGYVDANLPLETLRRAIHGTLQGEIAYPRRVLAAVFSVESGRASYSAKARVLTPRQRQVVGLIVRGATDKQIARELGIATTTAQKHVANLLHRLEVPNRAAAAVIFASSRPLGIS